MDKARKTATLPGELTFTTNGLVEQCSSLGQVVICTAASILASGKTTVTFAAAVRADLPAGTALVVTAQLAAAETDPNLDNNQASFTTQVQSSGSARYLPFIQN